MEPKFTKGEWFAVEYANYTEIQNGPSYFDKSILDSVNVGIEEAKANARLICAAPDLYHALEELIQVKEWKDKNGKDEHYLRAQPVAWENAKRAIEKVNNS